MRGPWPQPDPVLGFYGPGSRMWRINREAVLLGAGPAALLLQVAHPLVAEGVAAHSRVADDPFGRLRRTLLTTLDLVFGDGPTAERAVRRLNGVHAGVRGPVADPVARRATGAEQYRAMDPELLLWVQTTLIVTSVDAYSRWVGRLSDADLEAFWGEARRVGVRMGIPLSVSPPGWDGLRAYWERMLAPDGPIQVTPTALALAPLIRRPALPLTPGPVVDWLALPGLALLPSRIRDAYGIAWGPAEERRARRLGLAVRAWTSVVPADWRSMPPARRAYRRTRGARMPLPEPPPSAPAGVDR
ncbi:MAG: oxygenase MpaB family protein [Chloroflexota bacterium]